jgi:hypothetical protein
MQHTNYTGSKRERYWIWDRVLARLSIPALEKVYGISLKAKVVRLFLIFIANGRRIFRS